MADEAADQLETDVDEVIAMNGGDMRATIKTLLVVNGTLMLENARLEAATSKGFARGREKKALGS